MPLLERVKTLRTILAALASFVVAQGAMAEQELFGQFEISFTEGDAVVVARTRTRYDGRGQIPIYRDTDTGALLGEAEITITTLTSGMCSGQSTEVEKWTVSGSVQGDELSFSPFYEVKSQGTASMRCRGQGRISGAFSTEQPWGVLDVVMNTRDGTSTHEEVIGNGTQRIKFDFKSVCGRPDLPIGPSIQIDPSLRTRWPRDYRNGLTRADLTTMHVCGSILACDPTPPADGTWVHGLTVYPLEASNIDPVVTTWPTRVGPTALCYAVSVIRMKFDPIRIYTALEHSGSRPGQRTCAERVLLTHEERHAAVWDTDGVAYLNRWQQSILRNRTLPTETRPWRVENQATGDGRLRQLIEKARTEQVGEFVAAANRVRDLIDTPEAMATQVRSCEARCWQPTPPSSCD